MSLNSSVLQRLPDYIPKSEIRVEETYTIDELEDGTPRTEYTLDKAPYERLISVTGVDNGIETDFSIGEDVESRDANGDGEIDSVAFTGSVPDTGTEFTVEYEAVPIIVRYTGSYDDDMDHVGEAIDQGILGKYVETAPDEDLDYIGRQFGQIGRRQGRSESEYRSFLRSLVRAFSANGTHDDVKFAVASATRADPDNIVIEEDFEQVGFEIRINDDSDNVVITPSLNDLIQLSSPTGVELLSAPVVVFGTGVANARAISGSTDTADKIGILTIGEFTLE